MSIFDLHGLGEEDMSAFCQLATNFHQDFDLEKISFRRGIEAAFNWREPEWQAQVRMQVAKALAAVPDENDFITLFVNAGADNWAGNARAELEAWLAETDK